MVPSPSQTVSVLASGESTAPADRPVLRPQILGLGALNIPAEQPVLRVADGEQETAVGRPAFHIRPAAGASVSTGAAIRSSVPEEQVAVLVADGHFGAVRRPEETRSHRGVAVERSQRFARLRVPEPDGVAAAAGSQRPVGGPGEVAHPVSVARKDESGLPGFGVPEPHCGVAAAAARGDGLAVRRPGHGVRPALADGDGQSRLVLVAPEPERPVAAAGSQPLAVGRPRQGPDILGVPRANLRTPFPFGAASTGRRRPHHVRRRGRPFSPTTPARGHICRLSSRVGFLAGWPPSPREARRFGRRTPGTCRRATRPGRPCRRAATVPAGPTRRPKYEPFYPRRPSPASCRRATRRWS